MGGFRSFRKLGVSDFEVFKIRSYFRYYIGVPYFSETQCRLRVDVWSSRLCRRWALLGSKQVLHLRVWAFGVWVFQSGLARFRVWGTEVLIRGVEGWPFCGMQCGFMVSGCDVEALNMVSCFGFINLPLSSLVPSHGYWDLDIVSPKLKSDAAFVAFSRCLKSFNGTRVSACRVEIKQCFPNALHNSVESRKSPTVTLNR